WRYVFLFSLIPALLALYIRFSLKDTWAFQEAKSQKKIKRAPIITLFKKENRKTFFLLMATTTGFFLTSYSFFLPTVLEKAPSTLPFGVASLWYTYISLAAIIGTIVAGAASQKLGRRGLGILWSVITIILLVPLFYLTMRGAMIYSPLLALPSGLALGFLIQGIYGLMPAITSERFTTEVRSSGAGFGYSAGIFIGGWDAFYIIFLHNAFIHIDTPTNLWFTGAILNMIGFIIIAIFLYLGPETRDVDLT
ncbi:MAG: MFS transporter, partial [Caldisphaera sp.]